MPNPNGVPDVRVNGDVVQPSKKIKADVELKKTISQIVNDAPKLQAK